ncbi:amino acid/amide ABC transporter membrane protein 1 (HAAT family) [Breoghania corrubedonensis]|uniref:Amino acid/amide ABC transporter membrane protein 1 (HAAT family) n=1 Tax=Breoghania corrubedonensis TaxID=665038 RepID=A0A2T5UYS4_9HYPH|nr:branched-chain amino acid ABC transporter permease [Breoghania corrubedonensis]PTW56621.1 amino acid/amide ABC transporter membrane protein 1 (HAAT family) [Breoghania corrubedonensis]
MTADIAAILAVDGIATGAIYVLIALGFVLIFAVTRVIFVPFGDIAAFTALTVAALELKQVPGTVGLVAALAVLATLVEVVSLLRARSPGRIPKALVFYLVLPLAAAGAVWLTAGHALPMALRIVLSLVLILPVAPLLDRIVYRPIADASVLLLLTVSMALHFALVGLGLLFFGPEGVRTETLTDATFEFGSVFVPGQTVMIVGAALLFSALLYLFFEFTLTGKALHATAINRTGARLMGIRPERAGTIAYLLGSLLAGVSGILIAPVNTIFYDSGFLIGLKAFVGAIIGGLVSFPVTALGSVLVGLLESFASFQSSAYKEVIVFSILIPVLLWRSYTTVHSEEDTEE